MISVSDEWKNNFYEYRTHLQIRAILTIASGTVYYLDYEDGDDDFIELALADATSSESSFDVGNFVLNTCTFKLNNSDRRWKNIILENAKLEPYIGMALESGDVEWVKKGTFYVTDTGKRGSRISLTAYDNTNAFETSFSGVSITYPITLANFVKTICDYVGITLATTTFPNSTYSISTAPNTSSTDYTCRQMISYAAMLAGCYARCNVDGELELKWYDSATNIHTIPAYSSLENNEKDTEITGVKVVAMASENVDSSTDDEDSSESTSDEYTYGSDDDYLITIQENPLIPYGSAETVAKLIGAQIVGTTFRSSEISALYDPSMEAGDTIQTENEDGDTITFYAANISVTLGSYATIKCSSDEDNSNSGSTSVLSYIMGQAADLVNAKFENFITKNLSAEVANIGFLKADELEAELATIGYLTAEEIEATYIKADELEAAVATFGYLTADELEALIGNFGYLTADSATITELYSKVSTIETAYIDTETVNNLLANYVIASDLDAAVANIVKLTTSDLYAAIADIGYLTVDSAVITEFTSDIGAINYLLSGYTSTETAQVINLSSANVIIADATITDAMIASVTADKLTAGTIYTDYVKIANNTGENMLIDGATIWMKDASGTYRMQLGLDASDEYNLYFWDADGNITFNTAGLTEEGLTGNGAIIRDAAVADDAAISGYKIDIESMTAYLNDYGQIVVGATNITIDDTTLDYKITEITGVLNSSVATITRYFALGDSDEEPPCEPGEEISSCIVGTFYVGEAIVDAETWEDIWTTERLIPDEDTYLWYADLVEKADGTSYWKTPTCVTDGYVKTTTSTLTTELEVIQGYIDARIWQTDITEAINAATGELTTTINDQYSELTLTINSISEEVGDLTTTVSDNYSELSGKVTSVETTVNGIETSISDINEYVSENYTSLNDKITTVSETVDGITTTISDLQTVVTDNYETLSSNITTLTTTTDGIAGSVSSLETTVGEYYTELSGQIEGAVTKVTYYYSLSDSDEEPSCEPEEELSNSIVGGFLVGQAVVDADSWEDIWSTEKKTAGEGTYLWIVAKVELADGSYYWTSYFCSTDGYVRDEAETLSEKYAELVVELDSITMQVSSLSTTIDGNYETLVEKISEVTLTAEAFETEVSETYATKKTVGSSDAAEDADETTQDLLLDENGDPLSVYDALVKIASHLTQTSSSLSIEFEEVSADLSALVDGTIAGLQTDSETFSSKLSYVNITSEPAIELGASDSDFKVKITNSEIDFMDGDSKVAWISNQQLHITEAEVDIVNVGSKLSFWDSFSFINISGALVLVGEGYTEIVDDSEDDEIEEAS